MTFFITESIIDCGPPPDVINGTYTLSDGTVEGSVAMYSCKSGFRLAKKKENSLTCTASGDWSGKMPGCKGRYMCNNVLKVSKYIIYNIQLHKWLHSF